MSAPVRDTFEFGEDTIRRVLVAGGWIEVLAESHAVRPDKDGWVGLELPQGEGTMFVRDEVIQAVHCVYDRHAAPVPSERER